MNNMKIEVPEPGFFIKEELAGRGWSQSDLAYILGMSVQQLNPVLAGKRAISTDMAKALGDAFEVAPEFFSNLQTAFDHYKSIEPDPAISRRAHLQKFYPIREMIKREWFVGVDDISLLEGQILRFFEKSDIKDIPYLAHAAKKPTYSENTSPAQLAWLYRVFQISSEITVPKYSRNNLESAVKNELSQLMVAPEEMKYVPEILAKCGVKLILVEKLPQAKIDGVCFWKNNQPTIGMSLRFDRIDNFWFVLRHEIEHVLQGHGKQKEIIDDLEGEKSGTGDDLPEEERIANRAAAEFCTPMSELSSFVARKNPYLSERDVLGFARRIGVHPGIVIGQIHNLRKDFTFLRRYLAKISNHIVPFAPHDGWGDVFPVEL